MRTPLCLLLALSAALLMSADEPPPVDAGKIINESYGFLRGREPEMTEAEFALYEQVVPMVFDQPDFALTLLETMIADDEPESPAFSFILGNVYFSQERLSLAEQSYRAAVAAFPDFLRAWENLAILYYTQERYAEAVPCLTRAIQLGNQEPRLRGLLGFCLERTGRTVAAEAAFLQAMATDPENRDWTDALLNLYLQTGQYERAEPLVRKLLGDQPEDSAHWRLYASILQTTGRPAEALAALAVATRFGWAAPSEQLLLGDLYAEQKLYGEAFEVYQTLLGSKPEAGSDRILAYAVTLLETGHADRAADVLESLPAELPRPLALRRQRLAARVLAAQGLAAEAQRAFEAILAQHPLDASSLLELGQLYEAAGERQRAAFCFEQALELPEATFQASLRLAQLAVEERAFGRAERLLKRALEIQDHPALRRYLAQIEAFAEDRPEIAHPAS